MSTAFMPMHAQTYIDGSLEVNTEKSASYVMPLPEDFKALLALNLLKDFVVALPISLLHNRPPLQEALGPIILMATSACAWAMKGTLNVGRPLGDATSGAVHLDIVILGREGILSHYSH
jgi:hypothetical protein